MESLLVVVALLAAALMFTILRSVSRLTSDPDSVASLFRLVQKEESILSRFSNKDKLDENALHKSISKDRYQLELSKNAASPTLCLLSSEPEADDGDKDKATKPATSSSKPQYIRPTELRPAVGISFILILAAAIGVLSYFKHQELVLHGMFQFSSRPYDHY